MKLASELQRSLLELAPLERAGDSSVVSEEQQKRDRLTKELADARSVLGTSQVNISDIEVDIRRIEADMSKLRQREKANKAGLGAAVDVEQRRDLQHDLSTTYRRLDDLRGELKECHDELHALRATAERHKARVAELSDALDRITVPTDNRAERISEPRALFVAATLADYDDQVEVYGVGAAAFNGRTCGGCFIVLPPMSVSQIRNAPADDVPRCPDCGTYLVRTTAGDAQ